MVAVRAFQHTSYNLDKAIPFHIPGKHPSDRQPTKTGQQLKTSLQSQMRAGQDVIQYS